MSSSRISRRKLMQKTGLSAGFFAAAATMPGPVRGYLLGQAGAQDGTPAPVIPVPTSSLPVKDAPNVVVWTYRPDIVQDNLKLWATATGQPDPRFADIPGIYDYANVIAAKFIGGEKIDMMYCHSDQVNRWHKAGWIRDDIESIDWVAELKTHLQPWGITNMSTFEGNMIGLPYWAGTKYWMYNSLHFEKAGIAAAPATWEEFEEQCKMLQGVGIANPYIPYWRKDFWALGWAIYVEAFSDGDYVWDDASNLTITGGDTPFRTMLERWKRMYDAGIVPPDAFDIGDPSVRYFTGEHTFVMLDDYTHKRANDPTVSTIAGNVHNFLNPGATHETAAISPMYVFGKNSNLDPATQNDLAKFYSNAYSDGIYHVGQRWILEEGLASIDTNIMNVPENRASFAKWRDVDIYDQQMALGRPRNIQKQLWYAEWEFTALSLIQEFVLGSKDIGEVLSGLQEALDGVKSLYPTF